MQDAARPGAASRTIARLRIVRTTSSRPRRPSIEFLELTNVSATAAILALSLAAGPLCGAPKADLVLGSGSAVAPVVSMAGGFAGYRPLAIPPRSSAVIVLQP